MQVIPCAGAAGLIRGSVVPIMLVVRCTGPGLVLASAPLPVSHTCSSEETDRTVAKRHVSTRSERQSRALTLPGGGQPDEHRIALRTTIATPAGNLPLITTHLNWRLDHSAVRQAQIRLIAETIAELDQDGLPAVLCGDFNAVPESDEIRMLTGLTWNHDSPHAARERLGPARIDYLFIRWHPDRPGPIQHTTVIHGHHGNVWASDHAGLAATLTITETDE